MNMLKMEENVKYRQTVKNVLEFEPEILKRFVNFMNNPDERTAVEQFGKGDKYFGATLLLVTMPGLPMFGHGQVEGFHEKYGMEYHRAYWDEPVDQHLVERHEREIFPLMRRRHIFSGSDQFVFYDFFSGNQVDENVFAYSNRYGDERGIILYNNRYGSTAGWIRMSCAALRKDAAGGTSLAQKTLGEALDFNSDGRHYYGFIDFATGLSYLRNGRELCEQGMFVEMEAYGYHAFVDFREIFDDDFGTWGTLCYRLNGRGVESLDEEVKQVRYGAANDALRALLVKLVSMAAEPEADTDAMIPPLEPLLAAFYKALLPQSKEKAQRAVLVAFGREITQALKESPVDVAERPYDWILLCTFLALHRVDALNGGIPGQIFDTFGLIRPVFECLDAIAAREPKPEAPLGHWEYAFLLRVLLKHEDFLSRFQKLGAPEACDGLFEDPSVEAFLQLHQSEGIDWFNKERFDILLHWLERLAPFAPGAPLAEPARQTVALIEESAAAAGYRLDHFMNIIEEREKE
jgi:hypothetical protein